MKNLVVLDYFFLSFCYKYKAKSDETNVYTPREKKIGIILI